MATMIATCGHDVTDEWDEVKDGVSWMEFADDYDNECISRAVAYGILCKKCIELYKEWGIVLENEQEEQDWLAGKTNYPLSDMEELWQKSLRP